MRKITPVHIAIAVVAAMLAYKFWPEGIGDVANLDSRGTNIIAFGDSLTAGFGAGQGEDYPSKLSASIGAPVINAGVNGDTTESALARLDNDVLTQSPRIVIVGLGGNDFLRRVPIQTTEANLRTIVQRIKASGAMVVLLGYEFPIGPDYGAMYEELADSEQCLFIGDMLDGIIRDPALRSDEIHPNAAGYALMAERVAGPMRRLLEKARR
jgi:acyl-CoA thioesterase I